MKNKDIDKPSSTNQLLRVVVALLLRQKAEEQQPLRQQIAILEDLGVSPAEISKIINRSSTYVSKELVGIRKSKKT